MAEKLKVLKDEADNLDIDGLKIIGLSKTFNIADKCCGTKKVEALKEVE